MNVLHDYRLVFLLPPRTGARYIFQTLMPLGMVSEGPRENVVSHSPWIPEGCEGYKTVLSVRNPYTRVVSCWAGWLPQVDPRLRRYRGDLNEFVIGMGRKLRQAMVPIADAYGLGTDYLIRQESLEADVKRLVPEHESNPHAREKYRSTPYGHDLMKMFSDRSRDMVAQLYQEDFEAFGYEI